VLDFNTLAEYQQSGANYYGPIMGRYGNPIANGRFVLNNNAFQTERNNNGHTLHGGPTGFHAQVWTAMQPDDHTLRLTYLSPDGEGGFPGTLDSAVSYSLISSMLQIEYALTTNQTTVVNPTSHAFFNLNGEGSGTVNHHVLVIDVGKYSASLRLYIFIRPNQQTHHSSPP
jgi:aldose 1-epimerase